MAWIKPTITITYSKIYITPKPEVSIPNYFCIIRSPKSCGQLEMRAIYGDLIKGQDSISLPYAGDFKVGKITKKRAYIKEVE